MKLLRKHELSYFRKKIIKINKKKGFLEKSVLGGNGFFNDDVEGFPAEADKGIYDDDSNSEDGRNFENFRYST